MLREFNLTDDDTLYLGMIIGRAMKLMKEGSLEASATQLTLDIATCHAFACPLRLKDLAGAEEDAFLFDVRNIYRLLNRRTRWLDEGFVPRYAVRPLVSQPERLLKGMVEWAETEICQHEETHRGGAIWEICDGCGKKWADDEGGKPPFQYPAEVAAAIYYFAAKTEG
jgi:hypothetical protein